MPGHIHLLWEPRRQSLAHAAPGLSLLSACGSCGSCQIPLRARSGNQRPPWCPPASWHAPWSPGRAEEETRREKRGHIDKPPSKQSSFDLGSALTLSFCSSLFHLGHSALLISQGGEGRCGSCCVVRRSFLSNAASHILRVQISAPVSSMTDSRGGSPPGL